MASPQHQPTQTGSTTSQHVPYSGSHHPSREDVNLIEDSIPRAILIPQSITAERLLPDTGEAKLQTMDTHSSVSHRDTHGCLSHRDAHCSPSRHSRVSHPPDAKTSSVSSHSDHHSGILAGKKLSQESSLNLSIHRESISSLHSDDSFHQPEYTVICPLGPSSQQAKSPPLKHIFSASPTQGIQISSSSGSHVRHYRNRTKSGSSLGSGYMGSVRGRMSHQISVATSRQTVNSGEPETQFHMSEQSVPQAVKRESIQTPLLHDDEHMSDKYHVSIEPEPSDMTIEGMMIPMVDFDDVLNEVDEGQRTMKSMKSMGGVSVDTQNSATYEHAPLQCGNIRFMKDSLDRSAFEPKKHYMCVPADTDTVEVSKFLSRYWGLRNPKIVLSVLSDVDNFKPWKTQRLKDDFQKGIVKAANTTTMWIVTNGIDGGIPKMIGDAVREENIQMINSLLLNNPGLSSTEQRRRRIALIGIVPRDMVAYGVFFDGSEGVQIKNVGQKPHSDIYELNPDHTHFILVEDDWRDGNFGGVRSAIEKQFQVKLSSGQKKCRRLMSIYPGSEDSMSDENDVTERIPEGPENTIPVVGLLVQGSPRNMDQVLVYLQNKMPVVVLKGSGGIADILVYALEEMMERGEADTDYEENFLKPELIKLITRHYPSYFDENEQAKFTLRDKILECVKVANEGGDQTFLTVVNMKGWGSSLKDLDKYILRALFKSEKHEGTRWREQLQSDLQLTVDWNRPDLASEIFQQDFQRVRIDKSMFEQSLLKKDREELVDLFLSQGVKVHKFLNHKKLIHLFERSEDREFFINVCMEGVLGITMVPDQPLEPTFLSESLNRLIYKLSNIRDFIQPYELSMSSTGLYIVDPAVSEMKALYSLIIWAVLMNRHKLAKTLWNRVDDPIGVALICSSIYHDLSLLPMEQYLKTEMEENASEFGQMALGALAICWRDSSAQAYYMLGKHLPYCNNKTVIEIAHEAGYIHFLAHPCCQKWLTKMFFGHLQVKELDWGICRLPYWFKIIVSAFFIFPMYIWITFIPPKKKSVSDTGFDDLVGDYEDNDSYDEDMEVPLHVSKSAFDKQMKMKRASLGTRLKNKMSFHNKIKKRPRDIPFYSKLYLLWTAPITKFWTTQMFYFVYLALFCLATLWPTCGNAYLDMLLWFWTAVLLMELVCRTYIKYHKYRTLSLVGNCVEILIILVFLVLLLFTRILHSVTILSDYMQAKMILCYGLIYFFYRLLGVYLPISPTLGPMLLRINRMIKHDFVVFVRMFLIFMIVGGVTIQAAVYPNWPLGTEMARRVILRPIYAMFLTQINDLDGDASCSHLYNNVSQQCSSHSSLFSGQPVTSQESTISASLEKCPHSSFSGYVITLQYLLICKLVLVTLLFAMFALTIGKVDKEAGELWKFQRYALIADFIERFSLPPPFTVLSFIYLIVVYVYNALVRCTGKCQSFCCCRKQTIGKKFKAARSPRLKGSDDSIFWRRCAREYIDREEARREKEEQPAKQGDILLSLQEDLRSHRKNMKRLSDRVIELERMINSSRLYLEDIAHKLDKTEVMGITNVKGKFIHVAARQSPYPSTTITRFPVFDKYVPLEIVYDVYDPKTYTMSKNQFPDGEIDYADEDINEIRQLQEERVCMNDDEVEGLPPLPEFRPVWNSMVTFKDSGVQRQVDRRSWIYTDNQPLRYTLDALGIPQNPMGRTGMRGKGVLWRWGPNHVIKAVVTRWRRKYGPDLNTMTDFLYVEGKRVLEFIAVHKDNFMESSYGLPGDVLHGLANPYSILCQAFMSNVFEEQHTDLYQHFEQSDLIQFFAQFASQLVGGSSTRTSYSVSDGVPGPVRSTSYSMATHISESRTNLRTETDQQGFSATLLYKGYLDDPRNTDNAWVEAEVWNFHYDIGDNFDLRIKEDSNVKWKEVSPYVKMFGNESVIVQEAARIHDAYH